MLLALGLLLSLSAHGALYGMTLTGLQYPAPSNGGEGASVTTVPLRGPPGQHGNVWGMSDPGTNILPCGSVGNTDVYERIYVEKGTYFNLLGRIWSTENGEGTLTFSIKYGQRPDFRDDPGMLLLEYRPALTETPFNWFTTTNIPEPAFTDNATIQVAYTTGVRPANWTEETFDDPRDRPWSTVYQCIDLSVTGARPRPAGAGDSYDPLDYVGPTPSSGPGTHADPPFSDPQDGKMPVLNIVLIAVAVFLALLAILVCVCCLMRKKKRPVEPPAKPTGFTEPGETAAPIPPPPPPSDGNTVHFKIHDADPPSPPPVETPGEPPEMEREGSHGRLFHFKYTYLDGDEENVEEDRAVQRRTLERRALESEFEDHKHT